MITFDDKQQQPAGHVEIDEESLPWRVPLWGDEGGIVANRICDDKRGRTIEIATEWGSVSLHVTPSGCISIVQPPRQREGQS